MEFGAPHQSPILGYGFALRHGHSDMERAAPALVQFDVSRTGTLTRLAGIPVSAQAFKLGQTDDASDLDPETEQPENTPWYARQWVLWTAGGIALTAALASGGEDDPKSGNDFGFPNDGSAPNGIVTGGDNELCVFKGTPPFPDNCVPRP